MKSPDFDYLKAQSLTEVIALLTEHGDEARLLAGGQTLLATLNMRLSEPGLLIDINNLDELKGISVVGGNLRIGALVRHTEIEESSLVAQHAPLMAMAAPHIAHRAIRNLGTVGGSLAYADPAAEWPACVLALDGVLVMRGPGGERRVAAADFFVGLYTTAMQADEVLVACEIPLRKAASIHAFEELARRHGDYAIVGLALAAEMEGGKLRNTRITFLGLGNVPVRARQTEALLDGHALEASTVAQACAMLESELTGGMEPMGDLTNSPQTKRHLATVLLRRLLMQSLPQPLAN